MRRAGLILFQSIFAGPLCLFPLQWMLVVLLGVVQMGLPYVLFARSLRHVPTQEAALLTLIEPIANPVWVYLLWGETVHRVLGSAAASSLAGWRPLRLGHGKDQSQARSPDDEAVRSSASGPAELFQ